MLQQMSQDRLWSQIVAQAWSDNDFKRRLFSDPKVVFSEYGLELAEGIEVMVHDEGSELMMPDDTPTVRHFLIPVSPDGELIEEELVGAGASGESTAPWCYCGFCGRCGRCGCGGCA